MSEIPQRQAYGMALAEYGTLNSKVVVLDADVSSSTLTSYFARKFPDRFINVGVTEASMVDVGVGLALGGYIPFVNTFAALLTLRACEQIRTCVAYARTNVKLIGSYSGLSDYKDGPTHFATNDMAVIRSLPNMVVLSPADNIEAARLVPVIAEYEGPVYMRISRAVLPDVFGSSHTVAIGKGTLIQDGKDVTLIATGSLVSRCVEAAHQLTGQGVSVRLISMHSIKPLDQEMVLKAAEETGAIVTAEDHTIVGGLGSAVAEAVVLGRPVPMEMVGLADTFAETGPDPDTLMDAWGMSCQDVVSAVYQVLRRK
jgi:transketolase